MRCILFIVISLIWFTGNAQNITNAATGKPLISDTDVLIVGLNQAIPDSSKVLWPFHVGDNGYDNGCSYGDIVEFAKFLAHRSGGNIIKITSCQKPDFYCDCYRLKGTVLHRKNLWNTKICKVEDSLTKAKFGDSPKYAILYVYREKKGEGCLIGYDIHLGDDSVICRARNNSAYEIKLNKQGKIKIWAMTESKSKVTIDVKFGEEYYLNCGIKIGVFVGEPTLELVGKDGGEAMFNDIKKQEESK